MQVGKLDLAAVDQREPADAGAGEIESRGTAETTDAHHEHGCRREFRLAGRAHLGQGNLARVVGDVHGPSRIPTAAVDPFSSAVRVMLLLPHRQPALDLLYNVTARGKAGLPMRRGH